MLLHKLIKAFFVVVPMLAATQASAAPPAFQSLLRPAKSLSEPLVSTKATTPDEDRALNAALAGFSTRETSGNYIALERFTRDHPDTGWTAAIYTNLGFTYLHEGYFSKAADAWQAAWDLGKDATDPQARAMIDRAVGELARLKGNLGHMEQLSALLDAIGPRRVTGAATESLQQARELLTLAKTDPRHLYNCGPLALRALALTTSAKPEQVNFLQYFNAGADGTNLSEISTLADRLKLDHQLIFRKPGESVPVPAIVHWKVGHFATITRQENGRFFVRDAVFAGSGLWVTQAALDQEASGYFLVPESTTSATARAWRTVGTDEAATIWGKGPTNDTRPGDAGDPLVGKTGNPPPSSPPVAQGGAPKSTPAPEKECPLCSYGIRASSVSISLSDTPVGYDPPIGPSMRVRISYNQREDSQPANFSFSNVSPKWTFNWQTYIIDDPTQAGADVSRFLAEGGAYYYEDYDATRATFAPQDTDGSILSLVSLGDGHYRRSLKDGSAEFYEQSDGATSYPRRIFLSRVVDPQGNAATLHYDAQFRLTSITDATGRDTSFSYDVSGKPLLISRITDPFGRYASLAYDGSGRLSTITDIIGLTSRFTYDDNGLVTTLGTPYGTTSFRFTAPGTSAPPRFAQVTDTLGNKERVEWLEPAPIPDSEPTEAVPVGMPVSLQNEYLRYRNSFYWDKMAYGEADCADSGGCDYTKAKILQFLHMPGSSIKGTAIASEKSPLENRVWYNYEGQASGAIYQGTYSKPIAIGRVLDDGTTQIRRFAYNSLGNVTQETDPAGRETYYTYANGIDISSISQADAFGGQTVLAQFIYNGQRRPLYYTDAAGSTTRYTYNAAGQVLTATNALAETTTLAYDAAANLVSITNANDETAASFTYDAYARVRTYTDSEGWSVTYDYDANDRVTKITYPDGTAQSFIYDKLDLVEQIDREGRRWRYAYDAERRLVSRTDPMGETTRFTYTPVGKLATLTDAKGNVTTWTYDIQSRLVAKTYADDSAYGYSYDTTITRLKSIVDPLAQIKHYAYGIDDLLLGVSYTDTVNPTANVAFSYDPFFPRLVEMSDGVGTTAYSYQPSFTHGAQKLAAECFTPTGESSCGHTITYAYDALSRLAARTVSGSDPETFSYDAIGRLSGHESPLGSFAMSYLGQTQQMTERALLGSGATLKTTWDYLGNLGDRRLSGISNVGLVSGQYTNFTFQTSPENQFSAITQESDASVSLPDPEAQIASFNTLNQITAVSGQSYSHDANGNLLSDGTRTYGWDAEDRLVSIAYPTEGGKQTAFAYDGLGRRVTISETPAGGGSATTSHYVWCGIGPCQKRDAAYAPVRGYYSEGEYRIGAASDPALYYGIDQIGSVRRVFENTSSAPAYDYDPWGHALQTTAPLADYGFAGMFNHAPSRLGLTWFRAYDPNVGRWLSRDPLGEMTDPAGNLYAYVGNEPVNGTDVLGRLADQSNTGNYDRSCALENTPIDSVAANKPLETADLSDDLESLGGGIPRSVPTPRGATQFIFPNGMILRFDISPGQYKNKYGPHINLEGPWGNEHIPVSR